MNVISILAELRSERERLTEAILVIERLAAGGHKRRGRPPRWMTAAAAVADSGDGERPSGKRRKFSAATRAKMAAAQKKRWAAKKNAA